MRARPVLLSLLACAAAPAPQPPEPRPLEILAHAPSDSLSAALAAPFAAATGIAARADAFDGTLDTLRARMASGGAGVDLVLLDAPALAAACEAGLAEKLDPAAFGGAARFAAAAGECGVPAWLTTTGLAWDRAKIAATPDWADFFDVAKYPGQRGLRRGPRGALEIALLADGVAPADIYRTLRTPEGLDRAFRRLDQLRPYVTWYDSGDQARRLLIAGDVLMTSAPAAHAARAGTEARPIGWQPRNAIATVQAWAIPAASKRAAEAAQVIAFASLPAVAAHLAAAIPDQSLVRGAAAPDVPPALLIDEAFWRDAGPAVTERFTAWLTH